MTGEACMALFGDTAFLLSHIRRCFILGDESGICEHLVGDEWVTQDEVEAIYSSPGFVLPLVDTERDDFGGESPELFTKHGHVENRPSRVDGRLADLRNEKEVEKRFVNIDLRTMKVPCLTVEEKYELFTPAPSADIACGDRAASDSSARPPRKSALTQILQRAATEGHEEANPFSEFAQFDGHHLVPSSATSQASGAQRGGRALQRRPLRVYLWYLPAPENEMRRDPLLLQPIRGLTVADMVGLAHYQYCKEDRKPSVKHVRLSDLEVFPFDEDLNELECDFSSLSPQDELSKYQFETFAIVEKAKVRAFRESKRLSSSTNPNAAAASISMSLAGTNSPAADVCVRIFMAQGHSKIMCSPDSTLKDLLERVIRRRGLRQLDGYAYRLESLDAPDTQLDLSLRLAETGMRSFALVRDNSRRDPLVAPELGGDDMDPAVEIGSQVPPIPATPVPAPNTVVLNSQENLSQRQYRVQLKKGIINRDVYLTVSQEQVEVTPVAARTPWPLKKKSRHAYSMRLIADCEYDELKERSTVRKVTFKILYLPEENSQAAFFLEPSKCGAPTNSPWFEELQTLSFEAQWSTTRNVHTKLITILDFFMSPLRTAFLAQRNK